MARINSAVRRLIRSGTVQSAAMTSGVAEEFAKLYVAGSDVADAVEVGERMRSYGLLVSLAYLPQSDDESETPAVLARALEALGGDADGVELSVKPSSLGIRADGGLAARTLEDLCSAADERGALVTLEMQGVGEYQATIDLWREARASHPTLGLTLPADIRRSERDAERLAEDGTRLRLCIGSYPVPKPLGYRSEQDKSKALVRLIRTTMEAGGYAMVASHDPTIIAITQELARRNSLGGDAFEFQMFHGFRPLEQRRLTDIGYRSRTYLPFGPAWFEYLTTKIAARPRSAISYLRAVADKR